jgi:tripartite-type tricarboxylate transporter receptor subunit TctC
MKVSASGYRKFCMHLLAIMRLVAPLLAWLAGWSAFAGQETISFHGKTVTMIVGSAPGGGTDAFGRLVASFLANHLPGKPNIVVRNLPGADGITSMNFIAQQVAADGYTIAAEANNVANPILYRRPQARFDPVKFGIFGGAGRGGELLLISDEAEKRLHDKQARPVIMGSLSGAPRSGMQMVAWAIDRLDWNVRWVTGYRATNDLMLALERGEIDMTSTGNEFQIQSFLQSGKFKPLLQSGALKNGALAPRREFGDAPVLATVLEGRLDTPLLANAFEYWSAIAVMDKWLSLPPQSPAEILGVYRDAYQKVMQDPEYAERGKRVSDDFIPMSSADVEKLIVRLAGLPREATEYMTSMMEKQGLSLQ